MAKGVPVFPIAVVILVIAGIGYAVINAQDDGVSDDTIRIIEHTPVPRETFPPSVLFTYPVDGLTVYNPITVSIAIGGVRYAEEGDTSDPANGRGFIYIDREPPDPGEAVTPGERVIDMGANHRFELPPLEPGEHTLNLVWVTSENVRRDPPLGQTIKITVAEGTAPPTPEPTDTATPIPTPTPVASS